MNSRPDQILKAFTARNPGIWKYVEDVRAERGKYFNDWPEWCYLPVSATYTYVLRDSLPRNLSEELFAAPEVSQKISDASLASALAAWRVGRGYYHFDPDLAAALAETSLEGDLPVELFYRLPEWCVYLDLEGIAPDWGHGVFVYLESDYDSGVPELRLYFDAEPVMFCVPLHLTHKSIDGMLAESDALGAANALLSGDPDVIALHKTAKREFTPRRMELLRPVLNLVMYLCDTDAEYKGGGRPSRPAMIKTKRGLRLFPAATTRLWEVGQKTGELLRKARQFTPPEERNAPRPHLRRAHWHTYRVGEKRQGFRVRWLHPILVGKWEEEN